MAELAAARKSCLEEATQGKRTRQEYNINVILVIKLIIVANIQWHAGNKSYDCLWSRRQEVAVTRPPAFSRTVHTFSHIFAGGYAAGYYSYKWAEVLSADAYAAFEETVGADGSPSAQTGRKYREAILEAGGSRPAMESFKAFRGREPNLDALLRHQGMA